MMCSDKDNIMNLFKTKTTKNDSKPMCVNNVNGGGIKNKQQSENNIVKDVINIFRIKKENEAIKGRMIRDIRTRRRLL